MSGDAVLSRFSLISDNTHCTFAKKASLIGLNDLEGVPALYKALSRAAVPDEGIDGVVLELCDEGLKDADIVIWNMDPFSVYAKAQKVFIDGNLMFDRDNLLTKPVSDFDLGIIQPNLSRTE